MIYNMTMHCYKFGDGKFKLGLYIDKSYSHEENDTYRRFWTTSFHLGFYTIIFQYKGKQIGDPNEV